MGHTYVVYKPFIDKRIFTEAEVAELPEQPKMRNKKHGIYCNCRECEKAFCVVGGEVVNTKVVKTKKKETMAFVDLAYGMSKVVGRSSAATTRVGCRSSSTIATGIPSSSARSTGPTSACPGGDRSPRAR